MAKVTHARNQEINRMFNEKFAEARRLYGSVSFTGLYDLLAREFNLSSMQIRRIVKGY